MRACPRTALFLKRRGAGVTVSQAVLTTPAYVAEMVTMVEAATALVLTVKVAVVAPPAIVTLEGLWPPVATAGEHELHTTCANWAAQRHRAGKRTAALERLGLSEERGFESAEDYCSKIKREA